MSGVRSHQIKDGARIFPTKIEIICDFIVNTLRIRRRTPLHARFIFSYLHSGSHNQTREQRERKTMHAFFQLKKATPLIVIASAMIFAGSVSSATSPEETNSDIIDDALTTPTAVVADFNGDGHPDYVLRNPSTRQTAIWYLNNNVFI